MLFVPNNRILAFKLVYLLCCSELYSLFVKFLKYFRQFTRYFMKYFTPKNFMKFYITNCD